MSSKHSSKKSSKKSSRNNTSASTSDGGSEYSLRYDGKRVAKHIYEATPQPPKTCAQQASQAPDLTQYVWDYKNDENKNLGLETGAVVHNREWSYGLIKYASLVQVGVSFKAKCTFSFKDAGCSRTLKITDDTGYVHGELDLNIHAGTPCVCAVPKKEKIRVKDKVIRVPQKLSERRPEHCGGKDVIITAPMRAAGGYISREWHIDEIEDAHRIEHRALVDKYWDQNGHLTREEIEAYAKKLATDNNWNDGIYGN